VRLAARGRRDTDAGARAIDDPWLVAQLRRQAREIHLQSAFAAVGLTGLVLLIPG
jgi:hypothetical protein